MSDRPYVTLTGHTQKIARKSNSADNWVNEDKITLNLRSAIDFDILLYFYTLT